MAFLRGELFIGLGRVLLRLRGIGIAGVYVSVDLARREAGNP